MNPLRILLLPAALVLTLLACQNNAPTPASEAEDPSAAATPLEITGVAVGVNEAAETGPHTRFTATADWATDYSRQLEQLPFYEAPEAPPADPDEIVMEDVIAAFYPLGWSRAGHFAYATHSEGYSGAQVFNFVIRNLQTGETLWEQELYYAMVHDPADLYSEMVTDTVILTQGTESDTELFRYIWVLNEQRLLAQLEQAGIQFDPAVDFRKQTTYEGITFQVVRTSDPDDEMQEYTLQSNKLAPQIIYRDYFGLQPKVVGVLKSPFSETIAVVCSQQRTLFEMTNIVVPLLAGYRR